jgi:AcrR family transcriptional regulator
VKDTFNKISPEKRARIVRSSIEEFAEWGYERGSLDRIIQRSGISKGGLYEYISSKEELFLYVVDHAYTLLYDHIRSSLGEDLTALPGDILERFSVVSHAAIDFYLANPIQIKLITKTNHLLDEDLLARVRGIFMARFRAFFGDAEETGLAFDLDRILDLMEWLLLKTRNHFLDVYMTTRNARKVKREYIREWDFIISVLKNGIYNTKRR